jgi:hypothetical protein
LAIHHTNEADTPLRERPTAILARTRAWVRNALGLVERAPALRTRRAGQ